jgi:arylsulfatase A-like enzyme
VGDGEHVRIAWPLTTARFVLPGLAAILLAVALAFASSDRADRSPEIRRVVVIHLDTTRVDDLGCYDGIPRTPNVDAVAVRGMRYTNSIACTPKTSPSIATFMTGRLANRHGVYDVGGKLADEFTTLAEVLREDGFITGGFSSNVIVNTLPGSAESPGFDQGFDVFNGYLTRLDEAEGGRKPNAIPRVLCTEPIDDALAFIDRCGDERFFLWMLHLDPHAPYAPHAPYDTMYVDHPELLANSVRLDPSVIHRQAYVESRLNSHEYIARHMGEVTQLDHGLGRLFAKLEGLPGRTLLVITADHGESLGDAGNWFTHGGDIRHPCVNVPLIIACDGVVPVGVSDALVANADLAPTILELVGLSSAALDADGRTLLPTFSDPVPWPGRMIPIQKSIGSKWRGVRSARFCLQSLFDEDTRERRASILYDLERDPRETTDVSDLFPEVLRDHLRFEAEWFGRERLIGQDLRTDPEMARRLRALGYLK